MLSCFNKLLASQARFDRDTNGPVFWRNKIWRSGGCLMSEVSQSYLQVLGFCMFSLTGFLKMILLLHFDAFGDSESGSTATCYGLSWLVLHWVPLTCWKMTFEAIHCLNVTPKSFCLESICDLLRLSPVSSLPWDRALTPKDTFCLLDVGGSDKAAHDWEWDSLSHIATTLLSC